MDRHARHRHGIDRTRQALAEWRRGELQRQVPRRVSELRMVSFARRGEGSDRRMAATLQRGTSAFEPRLSHAERVRGSRNKASAPPCNGPGRYGIWGLRAPARCSTVPAGTNAASKGSRLKLTVVRRTWAGQRASRWQSRKQRRTGRSVAATRATTRMTTRRYPPPFKESIRAARRPQIGGKYCRIDGGEKRILLGRFAAKGHEPFRRGDEIARSQRRMGSPA